MTKESKLVDETVMYSVNRETGAVVTHHLPWASTSPQLEHYRQKGFTFEKPGTTNKEILMPLEGRRLHNGKKVITLTCPVVGCRKVCKSEFGLRVHSRVHKKEV